MQKLRPRSITAARRTAHNTLPYLHELSHKEHAAGLQARAIELHNVPVVQLGQRLHLLEEQLKLLAAGAVGLQHMNRQLPGVIPAPSAMITAGSLHTSLKEACRVYDCAAILYSTTAQQCQPKLQAHNELPTACSATVASMDKP